MWKKIVPLLIILSVALNIAFIGVWGLQVLQKCHTGRLAGEAADNGIWCPLHSSLGVTQEQWRVLEPGLIRFQRDTEAICQGINSRRGELLDLLVLPRPDRKAIAEKQEEIHLGQKQMQRLVIEHLLAEKEILTVRQQRDLFDMIRRHSGCVGHGLLRYSPPVVKEESI